MTDKVDLIIQKTLQEDREILRTIYNEITTKHSGETKRQHAIRAAIMKFEHRYPKIMEEFDVHMKRRKELAKNEHAADYDNDIRMEFAIPDGLEAVIQRLLNTIGEDKRFLSDEAEKEYKEKAWFSTAFPRYVVPLTL